MVRRPSKLDEVDREDRQKEVEIGPPTETEALLKYPVNMLACPCAS